MARLVQKLKSKVRGLLDRRPDLFSPLPTASSGEAEQSRSEIAAQLLRRKEKCGQEEAAPPASVVRNSRDSSIQTGPFPDFDHSIGLDYVKDVFRGVSPRFWGGERPRSWTSDCTVIDVRCDRWENADWPMSLVPVVNSTTDETVYAPVPFFAFPGYEVEDPPLYEWPMERPLENGEYSEDSDGLDRSLSDVFDTLDDTDEDVGESISGTLADGKQVRWKFVDVIQPCQCRPTGLSASRRAKSFSSRRQKKSRVGCSYAFRQYLTGSRCFE